MCDGGLRDFKGLAWRQAQEHWDRRVGRAGDPQSKQVCDIFRRAVPSLRCKRVEDEPLGAKRPGLRRQKQGGLKLVAPCLFNVESRRGVSAQIKLSCKLKTRLCYSLYWHRAARNKRTLHHLASSHDSSLADSPCLRTKHLAKQSMKQETNSTAP